MKKVFMFLVLAVFASTGMLKAEEMKMAYVDVEKVFNEYDTTKQNDAKLKEEGKAKTTERASYVDEIKKLKEEAELLSEEAKKEKETVIEGKLKALREFDEKAKGELRSKRDFLLKKIFDDIKVTIEQMGKDGKYTIIFNDRALLYKSEALDITAEVIKKMNEKAKQDASKKKEAAPAEAQ